MVSGVRGEERAAQRHLVAEPGTQFVVSCRIQHELHDFHALDVVMIRRVLLLAESTHGTLLRSAFVGMGLTER